MRYGTNLINYATLSVCIYIEKEGARERTFSKHTNASTISRCNIVSGCRMNKHTTATQRDLHTYTYIPMLVIFKRTVITDIVEDEDFDKILISSLVDDDCGCSSGRGFSRLRLGDEPSPVRFRCRDEDDLTRARGRLRV